MSELSRTDVLPPAITTLEDAGHVLKTIVVAEAGERHWRRAKDTTKLFAAIDLKIEAQAGYIVWRDGVVAHGGKQNRGAAILPTADPGDKIAHRWRKRLCAKDRSNKGTVKDAAKIAAVKRDAQHRAQRICEQENDGTVRGTEGTGEFERYTPAFYIDKAREVLGAIDLDPASCEQAQKIVQATEYFTAADDGLARDWHGRVWLNPPYHRELVPAFIDKLVVEIGEGHVTAAIVLTNNSTDTEWFSVASSMCAAICFTRGRIRFQVPDGAPPVLPTQGQAFFYFGPDTKRLVEVFDGRQAPDDAPVIGWCARPV